MRSKELISILLLITELLSVSAHAIESNCPWNLHLLMGKAAADRLEPSTQLALQDILKAVYDNPPDPGKPLNSKTSVADDLWLNDFSMWDIVKQMAELGQERLHREKLERRRRLMRASFFGTVGLLGGGAILSFALDPNRFSLIDPVYTYDEEEEDQHETGLRLMRAKVDVLTGKKSPEPAYELLMKMLACDPHRDLAPTKDRIGDLFSEDERRIKIAPEKVVERLVMGSSREEDSRTYKEREERSYENFGQILKLYREFGVIFCTRWGHPSAGKIDEYGMRDLSSSLANLPKGLFKGQDTRFVMKDFSYWIPSSEYPTRLEVQLGQSGELELFTGSHLGRVVQRDAIGASLAKSRYENWSSEKKQAWETALKGKKGEAVEEVYFQIALNSGAHPSSVSIPRDFMFFLLVAVNLGAEDARRLSRRNPEAAKMIGEAKKELGFSSSDWLLTE